MGTREDINFARELLREAIEDNGNFNRKLWEVWDKLVHAEDTLPAAPEPTPIKDVRVYIASRSRYGVSHAVTVHDGKLRCTCEDATYRPDNGPCWHAAQALNNGSVDPRAVWDGGLNGRPDPFDLSKIDELLLDVN